MKYYKDLSPWEQKYYKDKRCSFCLWEKPCRYVTCPNGVYSNEGEHFLVWSPMNDKRRFIIHRQAYYKEGREEDTVTWMLKGLNGTTIR